VVGEKASRRGQRTSGSAQIAISLLMKLAEIFCQSGVLGSVGTLSRLRFAFLGFATKLLRNSEGGRWQTSASDAATA
jgi:hypothetical protein